ncbi:CRISPR-associated RAMP protein Csx10 [Halotia wernerae UHCC 0503]|nr:CRISPR-associated RAMP protein Csx10 [Halotia wernerae UHCC 0503]
MTQAKTRIEITITALSPLAIGKEKPGGSINEVEKYIPGSVLRGAVAKQILQHHPGMELENLNVIADNNHFQQLFLNANPAIFQNAYSAVAKVEGVYQVVEDAIKVLPATAVSSKANPGFTGNNHGVFDTLIDSFCAENFNCSYDPSSLKALADGIDARVESYSSFYSKQGNKYHNHTITSRLLTRVGINRRRATAAEDILYSIEVLNEAFLQKNNKTIKVPKETDFQEIEWNNYVYRSCIIVPHKNLAEKLTNFLNNNSDNFRLGGSISRGLGKVKIGAQLIQINNNVKNRIDEFNRKLKERWESWSEAFGETTTNPFDNQLYFTIGLQSDAILLEDWQRTTVISAAMLKQFAGVKDEDDKSLKLHTVYSSYDYRSGWNSAWGLKKDVELVTNKGSVYLFSTTNPNLWYEKLFDLEYSAVGERISEGFGQVEICNEFHLVFREAAV